MEALNIKWAALFALITAVIVSGCSKRDTSEDEDAYVIESSVGSMNAAMNDTEQSQTYAAWRPIVPERHSSWQSLRDVLWTPAAYAETCGLDRFTPPVGSTSCAGTENNATVISQFDSCTVGSSDEFKLVGTVKLSFDSPATCDSWIDGGLPPSSGNVTRMTSNLVRYNPNDSRVESNSDPHQNYEGETISGGIRTNFLSVGSRSIDILGVHRVRYTPNNVKAYDHSVQTLAPIMVSGYKALGNRQVSSGSVAVYHNLAKYTAQIDVTGLLWSESCCHPTSGTVRYSLSGSKTGSVTADFGTGTCGEVLITKANGEEKTVDLSVCE